MVVSQEIISDKNNNYEPPLSESELKAVWDKWIEEHSDFIENINTDYRVVKEHPEVKYP